MNPDTAIRSLPVAGRWCLHSYYTLCPYAPDGSGRLLLAGADLESGSGEVMVVSPEGEVLSRFGTGALHAGFFHTGRWQAWSPDARHVYYQAGAQNAPRIVRRELASGTEIVLEGDMEGAPPDGEPLLSGLSGMLYAAGYADGTYRPELAPVPFQSRERHGLFEYDFDRASRRMRLSTAELLDRHPAKEKILQADRELKRGLSEREGLTLMAYCVRWNSSGSRLLFYFGNHNVDRRRGEPRLAYVFTADRELRDIHLAVDLSFGRRGVHWSWHPDGEHLIGYGPDPDDPQKLCLAQVKYDGSGYRRLSRHASGGHPSVCPSNHRLIVTDTYGHPGEVAFIDSRTDEIVLRHVVPLACGGDSIPPGRHPGRVDSHPVFDRTGDKVLINTLPGRHAVVCELNVPKMRE